MNPQWFLCFALAEMWKFSEAHGVKHLMRQLTYCHVVMMDAGYELEFNGEELWHVDPMDYKASRRLPEFSGDWAFDPNLPSQAHYSIGTCFYNMPRCMAGENYPPESIVPPTSQLYSKKDVKIGVQNTLICYVSDFHPPPVNISWTRNGKAVSDVDISETQYYSNPDFSFRIFSYLIFSPEQGDVYTCTVRHRGLEQDVTRFWEVEVSEDSEQMENTVLVVGTFIGFLGLLAGIIGIMMSKMKVLVV